ncbi:MAG: PTS sugar transporter subunit IIB [Bradymonadales bacterium]|nr:PTS sugar transporter subunit IIB [Bradymonadales bacterium]
MGTTTIRIDDRLIHSEVLYTLSQRPADHVIAASHLPWCDLANRSMLPPDTRLSTVDPMQVSQRILPEEDTLVVFGTLLDLRLAMHGGLAVESVRLANRARREGTHRLTDSCFLDADEWAVLVELVRAGTTIEAQLHPANPGIRLSADLLASLSPPWGSG